MKPLNWGIAVLIGLVGAVLGSLLSLATVMMGNTPLIVTPWLALLFLGVAIALWVAGREVRKLKQKKSTRMTPIQASRVAFFARSAVLNGAAFTGFLAGVGLIAATRLWAPAMASGALGAGAAGLAALAMTLIAAIVERWCVDDAGTDPGAKWELPDGGRTDKGTEAAHS